MERSILKRTVCTLGIIGFLMMAFCIGLPAQTGQKTVPILFLLKNGDHGLVLGASQGKNWLSWEKTYPLLKGGEKFQFYGAQSKAGQATGKKPELAPASGAAYYVPLANFKAKQTLIGFRDATWNPLPRAPKSLSPKSATYLSLVTEFLKQKGIADPKPVISNLWQIDLDGDGVQEVLMDVKSPGYEDVVGLDRPLKAGDFSLTLLRRVVNGKPQMNTLIGEIHHKAESDIPSEFTLSSVLDLNGDGKLEIIVQWRYYEGHGSNVFQMVNGQPKLVLAASDGA